MTEAANVAVTTITKADRERRKAFFRNAGLRLGGDHLDMAEQAADEAFAKHRLAHTSPDASALREALNKGLYLAVSTLAFHGRDRGTDRQDKMLDGLEIVARETDPVIRDALAALAPEPSARDTIIATADRLARRLGAEFVPHNAGAPEPSAAPIPMLLFCPRCHAQHVDEPELASGNGGFLPTEPGDVWDNPPHRSHLCHACGCIWRPADVATEGVREIATIGKADTWKPGQRSAAPVEEVERVARALCINAGDDPDREGPWSEWWHLSGYAVSARAALASSTSSADVAVPTDLLRARAIRIVQEEAREMGYMDEDIADFATPDGDEVLAVQAVERALLATARKGRDAG